MGLLNRVYAGTDPIKGLVVADGATAGTCVINTGSYEPLGIAVDVAPGGRVNIASVGEKAFAYVGATIAADASNFVTWDSDGKIIPVNPATADTAQYVLGFLVRPTGNETYAAGDLCEVVIHPFYLPIAAEG